MSHTCFGILIVERVGRTAVVRGEAYSLKTISFTIRKSTKEFMVFTAKAIAERLTPGASKCLRYSEQVESIAHVASIRAPQFFAVAFTDVRYPPSPAQQGLRTLLGWATDTGASALSHAQMSHELAAHVARFQDPTALDQLGRIRSEVERTKEIMIENISCLIDRGETIDDLLKSSEDLSFKTKQFVAASNKLKRRCCTVM